MVLERFTTAADGSFLDVRSRLPNVDVIVDIRTDTGVRAVGPVAVRPFDKRCQDRLALGLDDLFHFGLSEAVSRYDAIGQFKIVRRIGDLLQTVCR